MRHSEEGPSEDGLEDAAEVKRRMADAVEAVLPTHSGCGDPGRVTDAIVEEMRARGLEVATSAQWANVRAHFGDAIANGDLSAERQGDADPTLG